MNMIFLFGAMLLICGYILLAGAPAYYRSHNESSSKVYFVSCTSLMVSSCVCFILGFTILIGS